MPAGKAPVTAFRSTVSENMRASGFYRKLHEPDVVYPFDGSPQAQTWAALLDIREESLIRSAAVVIYEYSRLGFYSRSGENFHLIAELLSHVGWGDKEELQRFLGTHRAEIERLARESRR
jgi:hypothetical protein